MFWPLLVEDHQFLLDKCMGSSAEGAVNDQSCRGAAKAFGIVLYFR